MGKGRRPDPRIESLDTYPRRWVRLNVAAEYLEIDYRTLCDWIDEGRINATPYGKQRRISIEELKRFHGEQTAA